MDIFKKLSEETIERKNKLDVEEKENIRKLKKLIDEHPVFTEIFITGDTHSNDLIYRQFNPNSYGITLAQKIDFLHHLIHYHIFDDGGYCLNPYYLEVKKHNEKVKEQFELELSQLTENDDIIDFKIKYRLNRIEHLQKKEYPAMYTTFNHEFGETCNGDGDDYDEILKNCKDLYDKEVERQERMRVQREKIWNNKHFKK